MRQPLLLLLLLKELALPLLQILQIKRTEGVSTTDIVGRMLTCTRVNPHMNKAQDNVSSRCAHGQRAVCLS
jgi:hypothetical protein